MTEQLCLESKIEAYLGDFGRYIQKMKLKYRVVMNIFMHRSLTKLMTSLFPVDKTDSNPHKQSSSFLPRGFDLWGLS